MDRDALIAAFGLCRTACIRAGTAAPINEPIYRATGKLMTAIDDMAEILTGDRTHFSRQGHTVKPATHGRNVKPWDSSRIRTLRSATRFCRLKRTLIARNPYPLLVARRRMIPDRLSVTTTCMPPNWPQRP
jgi:hypothetical protein